MRRESARPGRSFTVVFAAALLVAACSPKPVSDAVVDSTAAGSASGSSSGSSSAVPLPATPAAPVSANAADTGTVARLEREARALARTEGCAGVGQCRVAPIGHRACGGPRDYIAWCAATTDSAALFHKLDELSRAEEAQQAKAGEASTCEYRMPPNPTLAGGRCATSAGSGGRATVP